MTVEGGPTHTAGRSFPFLLSPLCHVPFFQEDVCPQWGRDASLSCTTCGWRTAYPSVLRRARSVVLESRDHFALPLFFLARLDSWTRRRRFRSPLFFRCSLPLT